jgi:LruC domain-containing protein
MKIRRVPQPLRWLFSLGMVLIACQSCTKQEDLKPSTAGAVTTDATVGANALTTYCKQVCLVAGQHTYVGTVNVGKDGGDLLVTYNLTAGNVYLEEIHLDVFSSVLELQAAKKVSGGGAIPGKFAYKQSFSKASRATTTTVRIKAADIPQTSNGCFFIAAHAALSNGETAWGGVCDSSPKGVKLDETKQFPGNNWSTYFEFCSSECSQTIDFTYAWEDLRDNNNDQDYNDLVVQSDVTKSATELKIDFLVTARGSTFDHSFLFKIPMAGVTGIFGADPAYPTYNDGTYYYVTVFGSTKNALPGVSNSPWANTDITVPCVAFASKQVTITLNSAFNYNASKPYEPLMRVWPSYVAGTGTSYDLNIYGVSANPSTYVGKDGKTYPNGILIPLDWRWPIEGVSVTVPYPSFTSLSDGFTPTWYNNLAVPSKTFDKAACK